MLGVMADSAEVIPFDVISDPVRSHCCMSALGLEVAVAASDVAEFIWIKTCEILISAWAWRLPHVALKLQQQHKKNQIVVHFDLVT